MIISNIQTEMYDNPLSKSSSKKSNKQALKSCKKLTVFELIRFRSRTIINFWRYKISQMVFIINRIRILKIKSINGHNFIYLVYKLVNNYYILCNL